MKVGQRVYFFNSIKIKCLGVVVECPENYRGLRNIEDYFWVKWDTSITPTNYKYKEAVLIKTVKTRNLPSWW